MSIFMKELTKREQRPQGRGWLFLPYDQLSYVIGPLS